MPTMFLRNLLKRDESIKRKRLLRVLGIDSAESLATVGDVVKATSDLVWKIKESIMDHELNCHHKDLATKQYVDEKISALVLSRVKNVKRKRAK